MLSPRARPFGSTSLYLPKCTSLFLLTSMLAPTVASGREFMQPRDQWPQIISHRGATGYMPEHSLQGYQLAIDLGTDYIEPDLCLSKDAVFVCIHDNTLDATTDIADHSEFADRQKEEGFYVADFTLEELKTLRVKQRSSSRTHIYDGYFQIPTLQEVTDLVWSYYEDTGRMVGIYPELKDPYYHNSLGFADSMEQMLVNQLDEAGYQITGCSTDMKQVNPVVIQCFEGVTLRNLKEITDIPRLMLIDSTAEWHNATLDGIAQFAHAVGPKKDIFEGIGLEEARDMVIQAQSRGLAVHPWTLRQDSAPSTPPINGSAEAESAYFYCCLGVDATFNEFPDHIRETINQLAVDPKDLCALADC